MPENEYEKLDQSEIYGKLAPIPQMMLRAFGSLRSIVERTTKAWDCDVYFED
ncbi:MAG: hypothetical protein LBT01_07540 [Spirochaetaceae bacterium]|jgi:hypothetical protein|nr:hypothetical protein [Spirochaetaceae bacterium]